MQMEDINTHAATHSNALQRKNNLISCLEVDMQRRERFESHEEPHHVCAGGVVGSVVERG